MYPWKTVITINRSRKTSIYLQIVNAIIKEILEGRIQPGQKLPGTRAISNILEVNRKTMVMAYDELMAQGWLVLSPSHGSFISNSLPLLKYQKLSQGINGLKSQKPVTGFKVVSKFPTIHQAMPSSELIEINDGSPDPRLAPLDDLMKRYRRIIADSRNKNLLNYSEVIGEKMLRSQLSNYLRETRGLVCTEEEIFITRGSQMAIYLLFNTLINSGDNIVIGDTSYPSADLTIRISGGNLVRIPVDEKGINVDQIEKLCKNKKLRAVYITPHHHFPTTVTLSAERRIKLVKLAQKYKFAIIEDDYDYDFHYSSSPILPLASFDTDGLVIYTGSFSKLLAPSLRVGYIVAPKNLIAELVKLRSLVDRQGDSILERAIAEMINEGEMARHLKKAVRVYKSRRDHFCNELSKYMGDKIKFKIPDGGMAVWVNFAKNIPLVKLSKLLLVENIYLNVDFEFIKRLNSTRLGFASLTEDEASLYLSKMAGCLDKLSVKV